MIELHEPNVGPRTLFECTALESTNAVAIPQLNSICRVRPRRPANRLLNSTLTIGALAMTPVITNQIRGRRRAGTAA
jgi:hypothetical protein